MLKNIIQLPGSIDCSSWLIVECVELCCPRSGLSASIAVTWMLQHVFQSDANILLNHFPALLMTVCIFGSMEWCHRTWKQCYYLEYIICRKTLIIHEDEEPKGVDSSFWLAYLYLSSLSAVLFQHFLCMILVNSISGENSSLSLLLVTILTINGILNIIFKWYRVSYILKFDIYVVGACGSQLVICT